MTAALRRLLLDSYAAALHAVDPYRLTAAAIVRDGGRLELGGVPVRPHARLFVVALGKAAGRMAAAAAEALGDLMADCVVVTDTGVSVPPGCTLFVAGHPLPDASSLAAGDSILRLAGRAGAGDVVLVLLSGGGSALAESLPDSLRLDDLVTVTRVLVGSPIPIGEVNAVRRGFSRLKGGGLLAASAPARVVTLAISDVPVDSPEDIASGPTVVTGFAAREALAVLERHGLTPAVPSAVIAHLRSAEPVPTPAASGVLRVLADARTAGRAAAAQLSGAGYSVPPIGILGGVAGAAGRETGRAARRAAPGEAWVGCGETVVQVGGDGAGGRNTEAALNAAQAIDGSDGIAMLFGATDGVDGTSSSRGAIVDGGTIGRGSSAGLDPAGALARSDSGTFLAASGDLIPGGPTGTNVGDVWAWARSR